MTFTDREVWEAAETLRAGHFDNPAKRAVIDEVAQFLSEHTRTGESVGDLLGAGHSAIALSERGIHVIAAEDCRWSERILGSRELAELAAEQIARDIPRCQVRLGSFGRVARLVSTAFYDTCGPYLASSSGEVREIARHELRAFAITVMLSRIEGMAGKTADHYLSLAKSGLAVDARAYRIVRTRKYLGDGRVPMAVFFLVWAGCTVDGCGNRYVARGLCDKHRMRENAEKARARHRLQYTDPDKREGYLAAKRSRMAAYKSDPDKKESINAAWTGAYRRRMTDPEYRERYNATRREWRRRKAAGVT